MERHFELSDSDFESQFADGTLDPTLFSHGAHLRIAWIHIRKYGIDKAIGNLCTQIKAFAHANGDKDKYNVTVTVAAVRAVYHFILKSKAKSFQEFENEFPELKNSFKGLFDSHYSEDIFKSAKAKKEYLPPDLSPFD